MKNYTFSIKTLGCKVNQYEEQLLRQNMVKLGFCEASPEEADIFIVNSCTVTSEADKKSLRVAKKIKRLNPCVKIFFTGCLAILEEDIKKLENTDEIHAVVTGKNKKNLPEIISRMISEQTKIEQDTVISAFSGHTRAFLKVQDGCNQTCSYCKVSIVRGPSVSRSDDQIHQEFEKLTKSGYKEIVLTGICIGAWQAEGGKELADLVDALACEKGDFRLRISSIEPNLVTDRLIDCIAHRDKVCEHLHLPLQSASNRVLKNMRRNYTKEEYSAIVERIRKKIPFAGITTDIICGYPGETDKDFKATYAFLEDLAPSRLHVFRYSDRKGTRSFREKDKIPGAIARERVDSLIKLGQRLERDFAKSFIGKIVDVLIEDVSSGSAGAGYTKEYARAKVDSPFLEKNVIFTAKVSSCDKKEPILICSKI